MFTIRLYLWILNLNFILVSGRRQQYIHFAFFPNYLEIWTSLVAQLVKNLPAMQETWVQSLGWDDPLEKGTATYSSIPAWRIPWTV